MKTHIKRWGNSLALKIPKSLATDAQLEIDELVDLSIDQGKIIITPVRQKEYSLDTLLEGVTENNIHKEYDSGAKTGEEIW